MGLVHITSWCPNFNGSHFGLPPSEIHRMTGLPPKIVWTMTYSHRPHWRKKIERDTPGRVRCEIKQKKSHGLDGIEHILLGNRSRHSFPGLWPILWCSFVLLAPFPLFISFLPIPFKASFCYERRRNALEHLTRIFSAVSYCWFNPQPMRKDHSIAGTTIFQTTPEDADNTQFYWLYDKSSDKVVVGPLPCHRICHTINNYCVLSASSSVIWKIVGLRLSDPFALVVGWINNNWLTFCYVPYTR